MFKAETTFRVRYADTDQMGYVYYGNYGRLYEIGRVEALRDLGLRYKTLEDSGVMMPVYEMKCRYFQPARYDDLLTIHTTITALPSTRIFFQFEIRNEENVLLNTGEVTLVFVKMATGRPTYAPELLLNALKPFFD